MSHTPTYKKHKRGPLDDRFEPICPTCGVLGPATDGEDARRVGRRHEAAMAADVVAGVE